MKYPNSAVRFGIVEASCGFADGTAALSGITRSSRIFNRCQLVMVTNEGQIEKAAVAVGARHQMRTLREHGELIGLGALAEHKRWR